MFLWLQSKHGLEEEKMDYLSMRLHTFESENERLKTESLRLKTENEKLKLVRFSYTMYPHLGETLRIFVMFVRYTIITWLNEKCSGSVIECKTWD